MPSSSSASTDTGTHATGEQTAGEQTAGERSYAGRSLADRKIERRGRFREAGLELFGTLGFSQVTVSAICTEAGLSRRQFYEEYTGRESLLAEIYDSIQLQTRDAVIAAVTSSVTDAEFDIATVARAAVTAYIDTITTDPRNIRCSFIEVGGVSDEVEHHRLAGRETWAGFIADTISSVPGTTARKIDYEATAYIGALTSVVHRWGTSDPRPDRSEVVDLLTGMLVHLALD